MKLQQHLFIAAIVLSTAMIPCLAHATHSPEISEQDLAPYKALGSGSIKGTLDILFDGYNERLESIPGHVKLSFIPVTPYTRWYVTEYRNVVLHGEVKFHPHGLIQMLYMVGTQPRLALPYLDQRVYHLVRSTTSQADGSYYLKNIAPGSYFLIAEWAITSRRWIEGYSYDEPSSQYQGLDGWTIYSPGGSRYVPAHWVAYRCLVFKTLEEPIVVTNNQTTSVDQLRDKLESRDCSTDSCGEFVQDQFFPKDNSLVIHQATLAPT